MKKFHSHYFSSQHGWTLVLPPLCPATPNKRIDSPHSVALYGIVSCCTVRCTPPPRHKLIIMTWIAGIFPLIHSSFSPLTHRLLFLFLGSFTIPASLRVTATYHPPLREPNRSASVRHFNLAERVELIDSSPALSSSQLSF
ncbi:hypothetical protein FRC18_006061 [Serendipita sp. 400]|nr:hypothetical protein FRC18_006061 [Serendipita sp. 400]